MKLNPLVWGKNLAIVLTSLAIFAAAVFVLSYLASIPSTKLKRAYEQRKQEEERLRGFLDCTVVDSGWQKRLAGVEEIYVPLIKINLTNKSSEGLNNITVRAYFMVENQSLCFDSVSIQKLDSGRSTELTFRCVESLGFGIFFKGLTLIQTTKRISYEISAAINNVSVSLGRGDLKFNLLLP